MTTPATRLPRPARNRPPPLLGRVEPSARPNVHPSAEDCAAAVIDVLPVAMAAMRSAMRQRIGDGLSVPQFRCLNFIDLHADSTVGEVASFLGVTLATASAMVDRLVQAGHVVAKVAAGDRRRSALRSLPSGQRLLAAMRLSTQADFAQKLRHHLPQDLADLLRGLQLLKSTFEPESTDVTTRRPGR